MVNKFLVNFYEVEKYCWRNEKKFFQLLYFYKRLASKEPIRFIFEYQ